jgi:hypothetical protein
VCLVLVLTVAGCGDDDATDTPDAAPSTASVRVGGSGGTFTIDALRVTVASATDEGADAETGGGTLRINPEREATHTIIGVELTVEAAADEPSGFSHDSIRATTADGALDTSFVCDAGSGEVQCAAETATWYVYPGSPRTFTVYFIAEQGTEVFDLEFTETAEPPPP